MQNVCKMAYAAQTRKTVPEAGGCFWKQQSIITSEAKRRIEHALSCLAARWWYKMGRRLGTYRPKNTGGLSRPETLDCEILFSTIIFYTFKSIREVAEALLTPFSIISWCASFPCLRLSDSEILDFNQYPNITSRDRQLMSSMWNTRSCAKKCAKAARNDIEEREGRLDIPK